MKNLYLKNKGKVYPSPSSSSSLSPATAATTTTTDSALSVLNFLPAAILALASILSVEDREVLAYLITTNPSSVIIEDKRRKCKKPHTRVPVFECGCFECYTSYWFRWDSSPNRELIHQVIEAFEEHLTSGDGRRNGGGGGGRGKKKEKQKVFDKTPEKKHIQRRSSEIAAEEMKPQIQIQVVVPMVSEVEEQEAAAAEEVVVGMGGGGCYNHKGLARKVLPDVMGLFNSRIWNLWSNNI